MAGRGTKLPGRKAVAKKKAVKKAPPKEKAARRGAKKAAKQDAAIGALPPKQRAFVLEYLANGMNATRAAVAAGYSQRTADSQGSRLLKNAKVAAVLAARSAKAMAKRELSAAMVLEEIAKMAFFDPRKLFTTDGGLIPITELGDDEAASIAGLEVVSKGGGKGSRARPVVLRKIKLADKGASLERLGRYFHLFVDRVEHSGSVGVELISSVPRPVREAKKETGK